MIFRRHTCCTLCVEELQKQKESKMYSWQDLTKSMDRNTEARKQNTLAMDKLALVVEKLYDQQTQQFAVPTHRMVDTD